MVYQSGDEIGRGSLIRGRFRVLDFFKRGGFSLSLLAADERNGNELCVVKAVLKDSAPAYELRRLLVEESCVLSRLSHPGIPRQMACFSDDKRIYAVFQRLQGWSLEDATILPGGAWERTVCSWMFQLCGILEYLHGQVPPVIHRNIKPANILIDDEGNISLVDFGCALSLDGLFARNRLPIGAKGFMAPESMSPDLVDARSDIYSVGATMWSMLAHSGRDALLSGFPVPDVRAFRSTDPEVWPPVSDDVASMVMKCLEVDPDNRFQSASELAVALREVLTARSE